MTNLTIPNVLNAKALEKQLKLVETRLQELQTETDALLRIKEACQLLINHSEPASESTKKNGESLQGPLEDLLRQKGTALSLDEITSELKESGVTLPEKKAAPLISSTLKKFPEIFTAVDDDRWMIVANSGGEVGESLPQ
jgi:YesN/AraC family two-component response regulator